MICLLKKCKPIHHPKIHKLQSQSLLQNCLQIQFHNIFLIFVSKRFERSINILNLCNAFRHHRPSFKSFFLNRNCDGRTCHSDRECLIYITITNFIIKIVDNHSSKVIKEGRKSNTPNCKEHLIEKISGKK